MFETVEGCDYRPSGAVCVRYLLGYLKNPPPFGTGLAYEDFSPRALCVSHTIRLPNNTLRHHMVTLFRHAWLLHSHYIPMTFP